MPEFSRWRSPAVLHSRLMDRRARAQSLQQSVAKLKMFIPQMICGEKEYQRLTYKCSSGIPKYYVEYKCLYLCPSHRRKSFSPLNMELSEETLHWSHRNVFTGEGGKLTQAFSKRSLTCRRRTCVPVPPFRRPARHQGDFSLFLLPLKRGLPMAASSTASACRLLVCKSLALYKE